MALWDENLVGKYVIVKKDSLDDIEYDENNDEVKATDYEDPITRVFLVEEERGIYRDPKVADGIMVVEGYECQFSLDDFERLATTEEITKAKLLAK